MRVSARSVAWLLPLMLSACMHRSNLSQVQPLAPPIEDAPPPKPDSAPANLPQPVITEPKPTAPPPALPIEETPKTLPKHPRKPAKSPAPAINQTAQVGSTQEPEVPAIGRLSSGEPDRDKRQTVDSINEVDKGLTGITRKLTDPEEKISTQIKEFLKQARAALLSGDLEAANTLAVKAKVLLGELNP